MFDLIEEITFGELRSDRYDRRGEIVRVKIKQVKNKSYAINQVGKLLCSLTSLLDRNYNGKWSIDFPEVNDCWIYFNYDSGNHILIHHKYWTDEKIQCFKTMLLSLAKLHSWEIKCWLNNTLKKWEN